jgi:hypothetical protein
MRYKIWRGTARTQEEFLYLKPQWMPKIRNSLSDALWDAMNTKEPQIAWEIEAEDGLSIGRREIVDMVRSKKKELIDNPPKQY